MARLSQRWLWLVNVAGILGAAWLLAGTANAVIAARLSARETAPAKRSPAAAPTVATHGVEHYLGPIRSRNIFNHGEPIPDEEVVGGGAVEAPSGPADACTLPIQVLATVVVVNQPELSLATLMDNSASPPAIVVVQVGERIADQATLVSVAEEYVDGSLGLVSICQLRRDDGRTEICRSDAGTAPAKSGGASMPVASAPAAPTGDSVKRISDTQFEVAQSEIDAIMSGGLATMAQDVRIVPYFEGGQSKGFKLYSIKPGSLLSKIGLSNGDVIQKVNGYDISSPEKALQVYGLLKSEKNVQVDLTRNGQNKSISYTIR